MHISWDDLQTVEALVRTGSVEATGRELSLRHSSVSRRIAALEARLEAALFVRGSRLVPTPLAAQIAARAGPMRTQAAEVAGLLTTERRERQQRLVMTASDVLAPLVFLALSSVAPNQPVEVLVSDQEMELVPGRVDLALRPKHDPSGALRGRRLGRLRIGLYGTSRGMTRWILPSPALRGRTSMRWWRHVPEDAPGAVSCDSLLGIRDACRAGLGRAAFPSFLAHGDPRLRLEKELDGGPPLWLLAPPARGVKREHQALQDALFQALRATEGAFVKQGAPPLHTTS
ncbi:LysR family transcriptional regulator [Comamonas sp. JC664]|uniref:LysR family transcriptional regulator n=1 Tax=Comamonas sp. JC664 TaxID=2801917 RepID=UPI0017499058|nr:LysR family transcriptional regulator [Comamonas sp. JC664]MBL0692865.1 LysR family transcriptional regulator [Comamonas sp. JC664]GHG90919.1 LysR family transcriptional regulator [Comamonas sp. KCTC 72670]